MSNLLKISEFVYYWSTYLCIFEVVLKNNPQNDISSQKDHIVNVEKQNCSPFFGNTTSIGYTEIISMTDISETSLDHIFILLSTQIGT